MYQYVPVCTSRWMGWLCKVCSYSCIYSLRNTHCHAKFCLISLINERNRMSLLHSIKVKDRQDWRWGGVCRLVVWWALCRGGNRARVRGPQDKKRTSGQGPAAQSCACCKLIERIQRITGSYYVLPSPVPLERMRGAKGGWGGGSKNKNP